MLKKKKASTLTRGEQSERFCEKVRELEAAGELSRIEADAKFERVMGKLALKEDSMRTPPKVRGSKKVASKKKDPSATKKIDRSRTKTDRSRTKIAPKPRPK